MFGPERLGGAGLTDGFSRQGTDGITHFLTHTRWNSDLGKVMLNVLSHLQLLSGHGACLLEEPEPLPLKIQSKKRNILHWNYLGRGWLLTLREYLHVIKGSIRTPSM